MIKCAGAKGLSTNSARIRALVSKRGVMSRLPDPATLAGRLSVSTMRSFICVDDERRPDALSGLSEQYLRDGRNDFSGQPPIPALVVSRHVATDQSEDRYERLGPAASAGAWKLPNGLDVSAQAETGDGEAGPGSIERRGGSRRNHGRGSRERLRRTSYRQEIIGKWTLFGIIPRTAGTEGGRNFRANWNGAASSS